MKGVGSLFQGALSIPYELTIFENPLAAVIVFVNANLIQGMSWVIRNVLVYLPWCSRTSPPWLYASYFRASKLQTKTRKTPGRETCVDKCGPQDYHSLCVVIFHLWLPPIFCSIKCGFNGEVPVRHSKPWKNWLHCLRLFVVSCEESVTSAKAR